MTSRATRTAAALTGALALASGAYAIGSQADDGSAVAADAADRTTQTREVHFRGPGGPGGHGVAPGLGSLADRLGVDEAKLREALDDLAPRADVRKDLAALLADELGVEQAKVEDAFETLRGQHEKRHAEMRAAFAADLAQALGISTAKVEDALAKNAPDRLHRRTPGARDRLAGPPSLGALARDLGVSRARLREAFESLHSAGGPGDRRAAPLPGAPGRERHVRPFPGGHGPAGPGPFGAELEELAKALGVGEDRLEDAMEAVHQRAGEEMRKRHDAFVTKLAQRLGIDRAKVADALPRPPRGPHGP